jgi:uncharacterized protein (DUF1330 family)
MKTQYAVALAMLAGTGIGALAVQGLHAQAKPPAYVIVDVTVSDEDNYQKELKGYGATVGKILTDGGGKYLARGGKIVAIEGAPSKRLVVLAFESLEKAEATMSSTAYRQARKPGDQYAKFRILAVEGVPQ